MKILSAAVFVFFAASLCCGGVTFELKFPRKEFKPNAKQKSMTKKLTFTPDNFVPGPEGGFAFQLSDKNAAAKDSLKFTAKDNFPLAAGSLEVTCKILKRQPNTAVRLLHVYSPSAKNRNLLIYYVYVNTSGDFGFIIQVKNKQYKLRIPGREFKADKFNTFKLTWKAGMMACYLNGELIEDCALPPEFVQIAAEPRRWSTLEFLPVFTQMRDSWENRVAVSSLIIRDSAE